MSDNLFERLKQILADGVILTPDIDAAVDLFIEQGEGMFSAMQLFAKYAEPSLKHNVFCLAHYRTASQAGETLGMSAEDSQVSAYIAVSVFGMMLGLLAAERIKTEVTK